MWIIIIIVVLAVLAIIGYKAEKKGYFIKEVKDEDLVDFSDLSKPKEEIKEVEKVEEEPKEEVDLSSSFDEMPDMNTLPEVATEEKKEEVIETEEDLYAPFGDQVFDDIKPTNNEMNNSVEEVVDNNIDTSYANEMEKNSKDITDKNNKKALKDLMQSQGNFDFDFNVEGATEDTKETFDVKEDKEEKKKKEEEELKDMWNY